jgi:hypothetical protein
MGTEGDSFYVVFEAAPDAVSCCLAAQQALAGYDWPDEAAVRIRMGLHSGEPTRHEDGYIGMDVHRAARIAATAHGGQVVLSDLGALPVASTDRQTDETGRDRSTSIWSSGRRHGRGKDLRRASRPLRRSAGTRSLPSMSGWRELQPGVATCRSSGWVRSELPD